MPNGEKAVSTNTEAVDFCAVQNSRLRTGGMGMTIEPGGVPIIGMRFCLTPQDIADESGSFIKGIRESTRHGRSSTVSSSGDRACDDRVSTTALELRVSLLRVESASSFRHRQRLQSVYLGPCIETVST